MAQVVVCRCGQRFAAAPQLMGQIVPCPMCGAMLSISWQSTDVQPPPIVATPQRPTDDEDDDLPRLASDATSNTASASSIAGRMWMVDAVRQSQRDAAWEAAAAAEDQSNLARMAALGNPTTFEPLRSPPESRKHTQAWELYLFGLVSVAAGITIIVHLTYIEQFGGRVKMPIVAFVIYSFFGKWAVGVPLVLFGFWLFGSAYYRVLAGPPRDEPPH